MPSEKEIEKATTTLKEAGMGIIPVKRELTVKIQFLGGKKFRHYTSGNGAGKLFTLYANPEKNQKNIVFVTPQKAHQLEKDYPGLFRILSGMKDIREYENKMVESYMTK